MFSGTPRVRFAPSPTGYLHLGGARTALFNWLFARHTNGTYLLRIEDTDRERSTEAFLAAQRAALVWLGLEADEELVFQTQRLDAYKAVIDQLLAEGKAYPCFCTPVAHDQKIEAHAKYQGTCRDAAWTKQDLHKEHAIRFRLPASEGLISFDDIIRGQISISFDQLDDFIIVRRDGMPVYNFVVVVDDIFMRITHIIRGEDHISNTPKQILIYQALGAHVPRFAHLPLILGPSGAPLSKRDGSTSIDEYRDEGFLPDALFNYLVRLGWSHGDQEVFSRKEMVNFFTLENIQKKGAVFDKKKLLWLNNIYLRDTSATCLLELLQEVQGGMLYRALLDAWQQDFAYAFIDLYKSRAKTLVDLAQDITALADDTPALEVSLIKKWHTAQSALMLKEFVAELVDIEVWQHEVLCERAKEICARHDAQLVSLAQATRLALSGKIAGPGVFEIAQLLGKERVLSRIERLIPLL